MKNENSHLDDAQLQFLIYGDEESEIFKQTSLHVDHCTTCRERLLEVSDSNINIDEMRSMLQGYRSASQEAPEPDEAIIDFLDAPSNPEMLGRLGRYEIERVIGRGGMGVVLKGFDSELNRPVAIKVLAQLIF